MQVTEETIRNLATLSNFALTEQESTRLMSNINEIIGYISQLDELDTTGLNPTYQVFEMENVWRPDQILPQDADREALLALTKEVENYQIKVPKVL